MNPTVDLISLAVGLVIPAVVSLVTRTAASAALKALISAMLAALSGGLSGALASLPHGWTQWEQILWSIGLAWIAAGVTFLTGYKPAGIHLAIHRATDGIGFGPRVAPEAGYARLPLLLLGIVVGALLAIFGYVGHVVGIMAVALAVVAGIAVFGALIVQIPAGRGRRRPRDALSP